MFDSRNPECRCPTGAVAEGTPVHFKITLPRALQCRAASLVIKEDKSANEQAFGMFWCGESDGREWWECHFAPAEAGLYFYYFSLETGSGTQAITRGAHNESVLGGAGGMRWQLTVYAKEFQTPDWLAGGVMYQIFPDRFFRSGQAKQGVPTDRKMHENWSELPDWEPNSQGKITNTDYFGGDLKGIQQKLGRLKELGVTCVYLNPIFESHSNHRYDTADYSKIDPLLGTEQDFSDLCAAAEQAGIRVILDGVFNHTGSDSVYFNRENRYPAQGAYNSQSSPYYNWYTFRRWPEEYDCWWNFKTLPNVNEENAQYRAYITGGNGIIQKWIDAGAAGWRLDVADELPDGFLEDLRAAAKAKSPQAMILGEVWEDASNKTAYGFRRKYLLGRQLDSVMNYPFRSAVLGFLTGADAADSLEIILGILENYPPQVVRILMNHIGTHDTERALTILGGEPLNGRGREWQRTACLSPQQREKGLRRLRLAALMQFTLPGVPCIYYGDEAGLEGYRDPFNRACYPWGQENGELMEWYKMLGAVRKQYQVLAQGEFTPLYAQGACMAYLRSVVGEQLLCAVNAGSEPHSIPLPPQWCAARAVTGPLPEDSGILRLPPESGALLYFRQRNCVVKRKKKFNGQTF